MVNNQLQSTTSGFPFKFFAAKDFDTAFILEYVYNGYEVFSETKREPIVSSGQISRGAFTLFQAGVISRICSLNEDYPESLFFSHEFNDMIRDMYVNFDGDVWNVADELQNLNSTFPMNQKLEQMFREDIEMALSMQQVSHLQNEGTYSTFKLFKAVQENGDVISSDAVIDYLFTNNPIVKVW